MDALSVDTKGVDAKGVDTNSVTQKLVIVAPLALLATLLINDQESHNQECGGL